MFTTPWNDGWQFANAKPRFGIGGATQPVTLPHDAQISTDTYAEAPGGAATLQAFAAARPDTAENYTTGAFTSYEGRWQAVLRSTAEPGAATLRVEAEGFAPAELMLTAV